MRPAVAFALFLAVAAAIPASAQHTTHRTAPAHAATRPSTHATSSATTRPSTTATTPAPPTTPVRVNTTNSRTTSATQPAAQALPAPQRKNPLLPPQIPVDQFFADLSTVQKAPTLTPQGFDPLYTEKDWQTYRAQFGAEMDGISHLKSSGVLELSNKLINAATGPEPATKDWTPGLQRLLLLRAATIVYRNRDGYPTANKAVTAYLAAMDKKSPAQVGALWSISNAMSRMAVTPKPERIRYDGIAARANMQLAMLMLEADQVEAAEAIIHQVGYHEGWLKSDPDTRAHIAQTRTRVNQAVAMMAYLATKYQPAIKNDESALLTVYLYGRFVKNNEAIVADLPGRVPNSRLAQLARSLEQAKGSPTASFAAAENLRIVASTLTDVGATTIRQRTLYAALQHYRTFLNTPDTERDRIHRTLARMNLEAVISDGARSSVPLDPFTVAAANTPNSAAPAGASPSAPPNRPAESPPKSAPAAPATMPAELPEIHAVG